MADIENEDGFDVEAPRRPMLNEGSGPDNEEASGRRSDEDGGDVELASLGLASLADGDSQLVSRSISWVNKRMYRLFLMASPLCVWYAPKLGASFAAKYDDDELVGSFQEWIDKVSYLVAFGFLMLGLCCGFPGCISASSRELVSLSDSIGQRFQAIFREPYSFLPR